MLHRTTARTAQKVLQRRWTALRPSASLWQRTYANNSNIPPNSDAKEALFQEVNEQQLPPLPNGGTLVDVNGLSTDQMEQGALLTDRLIQGEPYATTQFAMDALQFIHSGIGVPWWAAVVSVTVVVRTVLLPLHITSLKNSAKMREVQPEAKRINALMKSAGSKEERLELQMKLAETFKKHGVSPWKSITVPFLQIPIFVTMFSALRRLVVEVPDEMREGGILWFENLCFADPYYRLPILNATLFIITFRMGADGLPPAQRGIMNAVVSIMSGVMVYFSGAFPAALHIYWSSTALYSMAFSLLQRVEAFRNIFGLPAPPKFSLPKIPVKEKKADQKVQFFDGGKKKKSK